MCLKVTFLSPELDLECKDGQFFLMVNSPTLKKWPRYNKYEFIPLNLVQGKQPLFSVKASIDIFFMWPKRHVQEKLTKLSYCWPHKGKHSIVTVHCNLWLSGNKNTRNEEIVTVYHLVFNRKNPQLLLPFGPPFISLLLERKENV